MRRDGDWRGPLVYTGPLLNNKAMEAVYAALPTGPTLMGCSNYTALRPKGICSPDNSVLREFFYSSVFPAAAALPLFEAKILFFSSGKNKGFVVCAEAQMEAPGS